MLPDPLARDIRKDELRVKGLWKCNVAQICTLARLRTDAYGIIRRALYLVLSV